VTRSRDAGLRQQTAGGILMCLPVSRRTDDPGEESSGYPTGRLFSGGMGAEPLVQALPGAARPHTASPAQPLSGETKL